ncbi:MAG: hypothetical protein ACRD01_13555 [Terriglobales bacterium]
MNAPLARSPVHVASLAYYGGDYRQALADFQQAPHPDAFVSTMIGICQQKPGNVVAASAAIARAAKASGHNPPAAYARREAANFLGSHP